MGEARTRGLRVLWHRDGTPSLPRDMMPCRATCCRTERPGPHIQGDVRPLLREPWDLVIAFPPCNYLAHVR